MPQITTAVTITTKNTITTEATQTTISTTFGTIIHATTTSTTTSTATTISTTTTSTTMTTNTTPILGPLEIIPCPSFFDSPCKNGGRCFIFLPSDYFCQCVLGFAGRFCEDKLIP